MTRIETLNCWWDVVGETYDEVSQRYKKAMETQDPTFEFSGNLNNGITAAPARRMIPTDDIVQVEE